MKKDELVKTIQDLIASKKQRDQLSCLTVKTLESIKELLEEAE